MKLHYNRDDDTLMIQLSKKLVDDAFETENMIVHISEKGEPVLLEIFTDEGIGTLIHGHYR